MAIKLFFIFEQYENDTLKMPRYSLIQIQRM